jgi:arylsulfatase A-like enzyme
VKRSNIVFLTIDSLRSDKIYGKLKKSQIPNLEKIINQGLFFPNTISSADATDPSLGCIFTGKYPFKTDITLFKNHDKASFLFNFLKKNGYSRFSMLPDKTFFNTLSKNFENAEKYSIDPYALLYQGTGERILQQLESNFLTEPWIYYIHLMDLHPSGDQFFYPKEFDTDEYGENDYEKALSGIDVWIGKILKKINLETTLVILTSDHGDFIPDSGKRLDDVYSIQQKLRPLKQILPFDDNFWESCLKTIKYFVKKIRNSKLEKKATEFEKRSYLNRAEGYLFDEIIRVPLIFCGNRKYTNNIIQHQIGHIDILPTLFDLLDFPIPSDLDGESSLSLISNTPVDIKPIYFESVSTSTTKLGISIGVRTKKYKYFRTRLKNNIHLFDIENDPSEKNNLAKNMPELVDKMESILTKIQKSDNYKDNIKKIIKSKSSSLRLK